MRTFQPDPSPFGMPREQAEWIVRQLRRLSDFTSQSIEQATDADGRITQLEQHPPRTDNPHDTSWANLLSKPSCVMNWRGPWVSTNSYLQCDVTRDGFWTMVANQNTDERPAPQAIGDPFWVSGQPGTPSWATETATSSSLVTGQRYIWPTGGWRSRARLRIPVAGAAIEQELWLVLDPIGVPTYHRLYEISGPEAGDVGWVEVPMGITVSIPGSIIDLFQVTRALDQPTSWGGTWDYKRSNGDPSEKEIWHQSAGGGREMRIHHTDDADVDRSTELEALQVGDEIAGGGINWEIQSVDHQLDHVRFEVDPATRAVEGKYSFQFTTYAPQPIQYDRVLNHFASEAAVQGFYSESGYDPTGLVFDDHAYGVDLQVQDGIVSEHWDLLAYSGD